MPRHCEHFVQEYKRRAQGAVVVAAWFCYLRSPGGTLGRRRGLKTHQHQRCITDCQYLLQYSNTSPPYWRQITSMLAAWWVEGNQHELEATPPVALRIVLLTINATPHHPDRFALLPAKARLLSTQNANRNHLASQVVQQVGSFSVSSHFFPHRRYSLLAPNSTPRVTRISSLRRTCMLRIVS